MADLYHHFYIVLLLQCYHFSNGWKVIMVLRLVNYTHTHTHVYTRISCIWCYMTYLWCIYLLYVLCIWYLYDILFIYICICIYLFWLCICLIKEIFFNLLKTIYQKSRPMITPRGKMLKTFPLRRNSGPGTAVLACNPWYLKGRGKRIGVWGQPRQS
jgi:hypothetical protein